MWWSWSWQHVSPQHLPSLRTQPLNPVVERGFLRPKAIGIMFQHAIIQVWSCSIIILHVLGLRECHWEWKEYHLQQSLASLLGRLFQTLVEHQKVSLRPCGMAVDCLVLTDILEKRFDKNPIFAPGSVDFVEKEINSGWRVLLGNLGIRLTYMLASCRSLLLCAVNAVINGSEPMDCDRQSRYSSEGQAELPVGACRLC